MTEGQASNFLQRTRGARKIIVVDLGFLGDSVHLVPALWELRRRYPGAELHTLSAGVGAEVLKLAPCVTKAWAFPLTPESPPWWRHWGLIGALRREKFDVAYNFSGADRTIFLTALTGARWRVAHEAGRKHFWNRWLIADWISRRSRDLPVYEQRRQVLAACGFDLEPARFDLQPPEADRQWAKEAAPERPVHISINASAADKEWPLERWRGFVEGLAALRPGLAFVATAGPGVRERERLIAFRRIVKYNKFACLDSLSIGRFAALLERCQLHAGADSGALHLAMAMGAPTLGVFRQYEGLDEWRPRGPRRRALAGPTLDAVSSEAMVGEALAILQS